jgi:predicted hotdog family 3-hydroxylacyl-ACP dehydratase
MPMIGRDEILSLMPHAGRMCLIDEVRSWDDAGIACVARNHRAPDHPLRRFCRLSSLHLIEYGAQAMAIHGALLARVGGERPPPGVLVAVREFQANVAALDELEGILEICARPQLVRRDATIYTFEVDHAHATVARGRVSVLFSARC